MGRNIDYKSSFKKTAKKHINEYDDKQLQSLLQMIAEGKNLPEKYKDHKLRKPWKKGDKKPYREFHITNRLVVVYLILKDSIEVYALGTHKELNLAEKLKLR